VLLAFSFRRLFSVSFSADLLCLVTVLAVVGTTTVLAVGFNLVSPFIGAIKYDYQALPMFCLLGASLAAKCLVLRDSSSRVGGRRRLFSSVAWVGVVLLAASVIVNLCTLSLFSTQSYLLFKVQGQMGYDFYNFSPIAGLSYLLVFQGLGYALIILSVLWANKDKMRRLRKRVG
jgi:uncharacterized membrane protein